MRKLTFKTSKHVENNELVGLYFGKTDIEVIERKIRELLFSLEFMLTKDNYDELEQIENIRKICDKIAKEQF